MRCCNDDDIIGMPWRLDSLPLLPDGVWSRDRGTKVAALANDPPPLGRLALIHWDPLAALACLITSVRAESYIPRTV